MLFFASSWLEEKRCRSITNKFLPSRTAFSSVTNRVNVMRPRVEEHENEEGAIFIQQT
jgi:hypothetical protein